jgi:tetratricopeptide (TPR) repeat protein
MADDLASCGHDVATLAAVAHFVGKLSGQRFDRRTAAVRSKSLPQLDTPLVWPIELPATPGKRRGAREVPLPFTPAPAPVVPLAATPTRPLPVGPAPAPPLPAPPEKPAFWDTLIVQNPREPLASAPAGGRTMTGLGQPAHPALAANLPFTNLTPEPFRVGLPARTTSEVAAPPAPLPSKPPASGSNAIGFITPFEHDLPSAEARLHSSPGARWGVAERAGNPSSSGEVTRGGWARAWRLIPGQAHRHAWLGLIVALVAFPLTLGLIMWLRSAPVPGSSAPAAVVAAPAGPSDAPAPTPPSLEAGAREPGSPPSPVDVPATEPPKPSSSERRRLDTDAAARSTEARRDFSSPTLDDDQLVELFALERRSELPSCQERLGESISDYSGNDPKQSLKQLEAARREMMRGNDIAAHGFLCGAIAHDPTRVAAQQTFAELALQMGDPVQAKAAVERALGRSPRNTNLLTLLGDALALMGDLAGSRRVWLGTLPRKGTLAQRTRRLASSYRLMGDRAVATSSFGQARVYYRRALILTAGGFGPSLGLSEALSWLKNSRASLAWSERAARAFPKDSRVQLLFGDTLYENGRSEEARAAWQAALDAQPKSRAAARRLARGKP